MMVSCHCGNIFYWWSQVIRQNSNYPHHLIDSYLTNNLEAHVRLYKGRTYNMYSDLGKAN